MHTHYRSEIDRSTVRRVMSLGAARFIAIIIQQTRLQPCRHHSLTLTDEPKRGEGDGLFKCCSPPTINYVNQKIVTRYKYPIEPHLARRKDCKSRCHLANGLNRFRLSRCLYYISMGVSLSGFLIDATEMKWVCSSWPYFTIVGAICHTNCKLCAERQKHNHDVCST